MDFNEFSGAYVNLLGQIPTEPTDPDRMAFFHKINKEAFELLTDIKSYFNDELPKDE